MKAIAYLIVLAVVAVSMFTVAERLNAWEKANDYPYGMLCDVFNNCWEEKATTLINNKLKER